MSGEIIAQLRDMKVDLESYNSETEESIKASNEEIQLQIEEARINIKNLDVATHECRAGLEDILDKC